MARELFLPASCNDNHLDFFKFNNNTLEKSQFKYNMYSSLCLWLICSPDLRTSCLSSEFTSKLSILSLNGSFSQRIFSFLINTLNSPHRTLSILDLQHLHRGIILGLVRFETGLTVYVARGRNILLLVVKREVIKVLWLSLEIFANLVKIVSESEPKGWSTLRQVPDHWALSPARCSLFCWPYNSFF